MYETGNTSLLQIIFSSESMGDFLNKAEFVKNITEYDRNMLDELQKVHELVAKKDSDLKAEQASLAEMKTNLDQQEQELNVSSVCDKCKYIEICNESATCNFSVIRIRI